MKSGGFKTDISGISGVSGIKFSLDNFIELSFKLLSSYRKNKVMYACIYLFRHHKKMFKIQIKGMATIRYYTIK